MIKNVTEGYIFVYSKKTKIQNVIKKRNCPVENMVGMKTSNLSPATCRINSKIFSSGAAKFGVSGAYVQKIIRFRGLLHW